jgi:prepilin-type N-terminal cleavage/methylation domain-containing protein
MILGHPSSRSKDSGYTLLEMMVVVFVIAIIMGLSVPNLMAKVRRDPLSQGVHDFMEACRNAREIAIMSGDSMQVVVTGDNIMVEPAPKRDASRWIGDARGTAPESAGGVVSKSSKTAPFSAKLDETVAFDLKEARVNLRPIDPKLEGRLTIRFHPNGTCDQFSGDLQQIAIGKYQVTTEVTTGWVEAVRIK